MKKTELNRNDITYRLDKLPKLKTHSFLWQGQTGYLGSIIKRPVELTAILDKRNN